MNQVGVGKTPSANAATITWRGDARTGCQGDLEQSEAVIANLPSGDDRGQQRTFAGHDGDHFDDGVIGGDRCQLGCFRQYLRIDLPLSFSNYPVSV